MLQELTIQNFAIISYLKLSFHTGMTALTGETGAGKSIIIDAMSLLAGSRSSSDYIRQGSKSCLIEGIFELPQQESFFKLAEELGIDLTDEVLVVQRDIYHSGKSICRVNGRTLTLTNMRAVGEYLVDIQGQNEHQELMKAERHLELLDSFMDQDFKQLKNQYRQKYFETKQLESELQRLQQDEQAYVQRVDMLTFQQEEIADADLSEGEEEALVEERDKLLNYQKIVDTLALSYQVLTADGQSVVDQIAVAASEMQGIGKLDADYQAIAENLQSAHYLLQDAASDIGRQVENLESDEGRLEEVQQRLDLIHQLKRKYGQSITEILAYYQKIVSELEKSIYSEGKLENLEQALNEQQAALQKIAEQLQQQRLAVSRDIEQAIQSELHQLYMENTIFEIRFESLPELNENGLDRVEFYITTNIGEPLKPLVKVASGGELSRVMLALKTIFSQVQGMTSIVFDEVDTGVSGRVAQAIANKIHQISEASQVLCITHLPQVAAVADYEYYISKEVSNQRTETQVHQLNEEERVAEIARMLAGKEITELTLEHARELLQQAKK
ncbi:DNA repair protein RecN (Recombination protein N) [Enterococcus sp. PF1-24]|uniref:DNA repair protein RecN n=1 Tax=unclassified Enterococcus TaxID=2608891 RepID=UPI002476D839|nr:MULTISPECIES: DNA repair protein RecN [unclassified Enterococcus]MDH6364436.1 DNA repair protein RecN (Recombination protein N) [Enterococcus sp. PFB1-1]MDH6401541.1 DNA repair protein RecN (Recombination protein N) [Enterococcus sp. PF1-24]